LSFICRSSRQTRAETLQLLRGRLPRERHDLDGPRGRGSRDGQRAWFRRRR
jgi:hypothetical protein